MTDMSKLGAFMNIPALITDMGLNCAGLVSQKQVGASVQSCYALIPQESL